MKKIGILKAMRLCGAYEKMNAEERCSLQARRLKELVEYARKNSPFYQRLYRDVPTVPFISGSIVTYRKERA